MTGVCEFCMSDNPIKRYGFCEKCINELIKVCTCNKKFITEKPSIIKIQEHYYTMPEEIPNYFFKKIYGKMYGIEGCHGCKHKEKISIKNNLELAVQTKIDCCVFQKLEDPKSKQIYYEYVSDALNPDFDDYLTRNEIKVGEIFELPVDTGAKE